MIVCIHQANICCKQAWDIFLKDIWKGKIKTYQDISFVCPEDTRVPSNYDSWYGF